MRASVLVLSTLLVAGCGGGGDSAAKTAYLMQAEAVCARANADHKALKAPLAITELAPYVVQVVAIVDRAATQLQALSPPAADRTALEDHVFRPLRAQLVVAHAYAAQVQRAAKAHDQAALIRLLGDPPTKTRADLRWMANYGFSACVKAADTSD